MWFKKTYYLHISYKTIFNNGCSCTCGDCFIRWKNGNSDKLRQTIKSSVEKQFPNNKYEGLPTIVSITEIPKRVYKILVADL